MRRSWLPLAGALLGATLAGAWPAAARRASADEGPAPRLVLVSASAPEPHRARLLEDLQRSLGRLRLAVRDGAAGRGDAAAFTVEVTLPGRGGTVEVRDADGRRLLRRDLGDGSLEVRREEAALIVETGLESALFVGPGAPAASIAPGAGVASAPALASVPPVASAPPVASGALVEPSEPAAAEPVLVQARLGALLGLSAARGEGTTAGAALAAVLAAPGWAGRPSLWLLGQTNVPYTVAQTAADLLVRTGSVRLVPTVGVLGRDWGAIDVGIGAGVGLSRVSARRHSPLEDRDQSWRGSPLGTALAAGRLRVTPRIEALVVAQGDVDLRPRRYQIVQRDRVVETHSSPVLRGSLLFGLSFRLAGADEVAR